MDENENKVVGNETVPKSLAYAIFALLGILIVCAYLFAGRSIWQFINRPSTAVLALGKNIDFPVESEEEKTLSVIVNGVRVDFGEQKPALINDRVFVPVHGIFEALGYSAEWNGFTNTATFSGENEISITVDENFFTLNGENVELITTAIFVDGAAMFPVEYLAESIGYAESWHWESYTVFYDHESKFTTANPPPEIEEPAPTPPPQQTQVRRAPSPSPEPIPLVSCNPCKASGIVTCTSCNGIGGGRGTPQNASIPYEISHVSDVWWCTTCGGDGKITCRACSGSGWVN